MYAQDLGLKREHDPLPRGLHKEVLPVRDESACGHGPEFLNEIQQGSEEVRVDVTVPSEQGHGFHLGEHGQEQSVESEQDRVETEADHAYGYADSRHDEEKNRRGDPSKKRDAFIVCGFCGSGSENDLQTCRSYACPGIEDPGHPGAPAELWKRPSLCDSKHRCQTETDDTVGIDG